MGHGEANGGWRVSQVESLLNMPRRDITRSCYADLKRGGAGILQPADGTWGRRNYSIEDIAWLYLVKLQHDQGYSLPEIAKRMDTSAGVGALCEHLDAVADRAAEAYEEAFERRERARVLRCALGVRPCEVHDALECYLRNRIGDETLEIWRSVLRQLMPPFLADGYTPSSTPKRPIAYDGFSMNPEWTWQSSYGRGQVRSSVCAKPPSPGKKISNTPDREECWHD